MTSQSLKFVLNGAPCALTNQGAGNIIFRNGVPTCDKPTPVQPLSEALVEFEKGCEVRQQRQSDGTAAPPESVDSITEKDSHREPDRDEEPTISTASRPIFSQLDVNMLTAFSDLRPSPYTDWSLLQSKVNSPSDDADDTVVPIIELAIALFLHLHDGRRYTNLNKEGKSCVAQLLIDAHAECDGDCTARMRYRDVWLTMFGVSGHSSLTTPHQQQLLKKYILLMKDVLAARGHQAMRATSSELDQCVVLSAIRQLGHPDARTACTTTASAAAAHTHKERPTTVCDEISAWRQSCIQSPSQRDNQSHFWIETVAPDKLYSLVQREAERSDFSIDKYWSAKLPSKDDEFLLQLIKDSRRAGHKLAFANISRRIVLTTLHGCRENMSSSFYCQFRRNFARVYAACVNRHLASFELASYQGKSNFDTIVRLLHSCKNESKVLAEMDDSLIRLVFAQLENWTSLLPKSIN